MNAQIKSTIAIILSAAALGFSLYNFLQKPARAERYTVDTFYKETAIELGVKEKEYEQCLANNTYTENILEDVRETEAIVEVAQLQGIGTPFNLIITDTQAIPINGAYPYEAFEFVINQIKTNGTVSAESLLQIETAEIDYSIVDRIRPFEIDNDHYKGSNNPNITIIEYSDFECPFCSRVHGTLDQVVKNNNDITWVYRHLPLSFHPQAMPSAIISECIADQAGNEAFWEFSDIIFEDQDLLKL